MADMYTYLFPYENIPYGSKILIYGAGDVGQEYLRQMLITRYCDVIGFLDRAYDAYPQMVVPIYPPDEVRRLSFEYIVLAFKMGMHVRAVTQDLAEFGVSVNQIVYSEPRKTGDVLVTGASNFADMATSDFAFARAGISIALKYGPGLGDAIVKKKFFAELVAMLPDCKIDIYCPGVSGMVRSIYRGQKNLNAVIDDGGALYAKMMGQYDIALTLSFMVEVDGLHEETLLKSNADFANRMIKFREACEKYHLSNAAVVNRFVHFHRMKYMGLSYYTYLNYTGVFHITDQHTDIPLDASYEKKFQALGIGKRYITINYGGGVASSRKNNEVAKEWPFEHLEKFVRLFKEKYPDIQVVQLGTADTLRVDGADAYFMGESLELVKYILLHSRLHIDKEGGLVHLATQLGTKCVVCFGPTQEWFFGYLENINIKAGNCHGCYCLYDGFDVCARGMEKPECMWGITPEMVMERVEEYMGNDFSKR